MSLPLLSPLMLPPTFRCARTASRSLTAVVVVVGRRVPGCPSFSTRATTTTTPSRQCATDLQTLLEGSSETSALSLARQLSPAAREEIARIGRSSSSSSVAAAAAAATATTAHIPQPTSRDLQLVALNQLIPFIGFGIVDNAILIVAGDFIDTTLGVWLGISTLCAAAIGNIVSDLFGVGLGTAMEDFCATYLSVPQPQISQAQRQLRSVRFASQWGCAVGITLGCVIGMFPLLWMDSNRAKRLKQERLLDDLFHDVMTQAKTLIHADATCLYLRVHDLYDTLPASNSGSGSGVRRRRASATSQGEGFLYAKFVQGPSPAPTSGEGRVPAKTPTSLSTSTAKVVPLGRGIVSRAALTGEAIYVYDARNEPDFNPKSDVIQGFSPDQVKSMACVPVVDAQGNVMAVIQAIQKVDESLPSSSSSPTTTRGFTAQHVQQLQALASHVSMALQTMKDEEARVSLRDAVEILKDHGTHSNNHSTTTLVGQPPPTTPANATHRKRRPLFPEARGDPSVISSPYRA